MIDENDVALPFRAAALHMTQAEADDFSMRWNTTVNILREAFGKPPLSVEKDNFRQVKSLLGVYKLWYL